MYFDYTLIGQTLQRVDVAVAAAAFAADVAVDSVDAAAPVDAYVYGSAAVVVAAFPAYVAVDGSAAVVAAAFGWKG